MYYSTRPGDLHFLFYSIPGSGKRVLAGECLAGTTRGISTVTVGGDVAVDHKMMCFGHRSLSERKNYLPFGYFFAHAQNVRTKCTRRVVCECVGHEAKRS